MDLDFPGFLDSFADVPVAYTGVRSEDGLERTIADSMDVCLVDEGSAEVYEGSVAPTGEQVRTVILRRRDWHDATPPQAGDRVLLPAENITLRVSAVQADPLAYTLTTVGPRGA